MKFVDGSKFGTTVIMQDQAMIQEALTDLGGWTNRNGMKFNITECKVMHLGTNNMNFHYKLKAYQLKTSIEEKDLGVLVDGITREAEISCHHEKDKCECRIYESQPSQEAGKY